ncbi:MAG: hypothetical protein JWL72_3831 [Ilumatobacteraceae bacterium]|nr:hypothetical protein [Ilumatobacteraceae bacterium]MCU1390493.1 hypothetical protein [Ilumatobacteraceae bacterium]
MGLFDKVKDAVVEHKDEVEQGIEKAEALAKDKLPDNMDGKVGMAADKAEEAIDKLK